MSTTVGIDRININLAHVYLQGSFSSLTQHTLLRPTHANRIDVIPRHYLNFHALLRVKARIIPPRRNRITKTWKNFQKESKIRPLWNENYARKRSSPSTNVPISELGRNAREEKVVITWNGWNGWNGLRWNRCCSLHGREAAPRHTRVLQRECCLSPNTRVVSPDQSV